MTTASANSPSGPVLTGASVNIPPRRMSFDFSPARVPRYYVDNDPFKTTFVTALSALFPEGESFFVESVRHYRDRITDPVLKAQVSGFIGQEALHSQAHKAFNDAATAQGFNVDRLDRATGWLLRLVHRITPAIVHLAVTACLEHYTAIFTETLLRDKSDAAIIDTFSPEIRNLYLWHSVEENEHKTVAFDVYTTVGGGYLLRAAVMIPTTIIFFAVIFSFQLSLLAQDGQLLKARQNTAGMAYLMGFFRHIAGQFLDWFKPGFHPSHHDTDSLLAEWREKLFGEAGTLRDRVKLPVARKAPA